MQETTPVANRLENDDLFKQLNALARDDLFNQLKALADILDAAGIHQPNKLKDEVNQYKPKPSEHPT